MTANITANNSVDKRNLRRQKTRTQLIVAAREVMGRQGGDGATVSDIIATAGLGKGSFYNHFDDKEALLHAVMDDTIALFAVQILSLTDAMINPVEILAVSIRHFVRLSTQQPEVGRFITRGAAGRNLAEAHIGPWVYRDVQRGIDSGDFSCTDLTLFAAILAGSAESVVRGILDQRLSADAAAQLACAMLQVLGVPPSRAQNICQQSLSAIPSSLNQTV